MNKRVKIKELKNQLREYESMERISKLNLEFITSRKEVLKQELEELGVSSNSAQKGKIKDVLTDNQKINLIGGLTG